MLYALGLQSAATQVTPAELECILVYARSKQRLLEIGVYEGASTTHLIGAAAADAHIYAVDPFLRGRLGICWARGIALSQIAIGVRSNAGVRVHAIEQYSHDAAASIEGNFDFMFIDADHSLAGIRQDWDDWSGRVTEGGIIALHDTRVPAHNPSVAQLGSFQYFQSTIRIDPRFDLLRQVDSLSVLQRRPFRTT
jgi:predicted O-methyltransferase YrrM